MDLPEIEVLVAELETRLDRLRALYEQYFLGFEKTEPMVVRKDVDRRFDRLRKAQFRNTALRFRFTMLQQRYSTLGSYWQRVCRQIEEGTFKRHLQRAKARFGDAVLPERLDDASYEVDVELEDQEDVASAFTEEDFEPPAPPPRPALRVAALAAAVPKPPARELVLDDDDDAETNRPPPMRPAPKPFVPSLPLGRVAAGSLEAAPRSVDTRTPPVQVSRAGRIATAPPDSLAALRAEAQRLESHGDAAPAELGPRVVSARPRVAPLGLRTSVYAAANSTRTGDAVADGSRLGSAEPPPPSQLGGSQLGGSQLGGSQLGGSQLGGSQLGGSQLGGSQLGGSQLGGSQLGGSGAAPRILSVSASMRGAGSPASTREAVVSARDGGPSIAASSRAAPPAPSTSTRATAPVSRPASPVASSASGGLPDVRVRELYAQYIDAKRQRRESTAQVTFESVAKTLNESTTKLRERFAGKNVDFEVAEKDGKVVLKPVVKSNK